MNHEIQISIVIPIYNEEGNIAVLFKRLDAVIDKLNISKEYIFINDGSTDKSLDIIKELAEEYLYVKFISFSRNFGHQIAISAGLDYVRGARVVIIDADMQDPPELIPDMYSKMNSGYEVVYAKRRYRAGESMFKKGTAKLFYRILAKMTDINVPVDTGDFRMMDHKIVKILNNMPEQDKYLRGQIAWTGFRQTFLEYDRHERYSGKTAYPFKKMLHFAINGFTAFSNSPLKLATFAGFMSTFVAFIVTLVALYARYITGKVVPGWTSLMITIIFLGSIQLICIGIIGEYLGRLLTNARQRPLYIIDETNARKD